MLAGLHFELDFFQQVLPVLVGEGDAVELHAAREGRRGPGARQVTHVGDAFEQINHAFAGGRSFADTAGVFGEILYRAVGGLEVREEEVKVAGADFAGEREPRAAPQNERRGERYEHVEGAFQRGREAFAFRVLVETFG